MKLNTTGKITHTLYLSGKDIIDLLEALGSNYIPNETVEIVFKVPTGGDHSGSEVEFENDERVKVTWTEERG